MEVIRQEVGEAGDDLRVRQLRARQLLKGELEGKDLEEYVESRVLTTTLEKAQNWGRGNSMFPLGFGLACCAIEMITIIGSPRNDIARFGHEAVRASPRQADMMILSGRVSVKMAPIVRRIYDQMLEPKWVIAMGACVCGGGPYVKWGYNTVKGVHKIIPVDIFVPGCPPRPEALMDGILKLREKVSREEVFARRARTARELDGRYA